VKNHNSFRAVKLSLEYEIERQTGVLRAGGMVEQVTMGWDEAGNRTVVQRSKEHADDYRYFPEPDLPPLEISRQWVEEIRSRLPELSDVKQARFIADYGLISEQASVLVQEREVADYFEKVVAAYGGAARTAAAWISGDLFRLMRSQGVDITAVRVSPEALADLLILIDRGTIHVGIAKQVLAKMFASGQSAVKIVEAEGLAQVSDAQALKAAVEKVLAAHPDEVAKYRSGKTQIIGWLMGQVMRETRGKANPQLVRELLQQRL